MNRISIICLGLLVVFSAIIFSCASDEVESETSYLPFKSSQNGKWGLIGTDGTVLFEDEFKDQPTSVKNGRFLVRNGNGMWELYTADAKPEKIGEEYLEIADFTAPVTPSVKKNEKICLIDVDGNVKATLDKANNKNIIRCTKFSYGHATITTEDEKSGIINTKGEVIIEPKYEYIYPLTSGKFYAIERNDDSDISTVKILDKSAECVLEIKVGEGQKYKECRPDVSTSDYLAVSTSVDGETHWGYIDYNKEVKIKPSNKIRYIKSIRNDKFIFNDGENFGVMDFSGEIVLRAKYDNLEWADDKMLIAYDTDTKYSLINLDGDKITQEKYLSILPFYDGKHAAAKIDDNSWIFIDKNGEEIKIKNAPDIYYLGENSACWLVESDFVDVDAIVSRLKLDKNGLMGFSLDMTPQQMVKAYNEVEGNTNGSLGLTPEDNRRRDKLETNYSSRGLDIVSKLYYQMYMTEDADEKTIWSKDHPAYIEAYVRGNMIKDKVELLYAQVAATVKSFGKVMKENSGAAIIQLSDERGWVVTNEKSQLHVKIYNNSSYQDYYIDSYAKEGETTREYFKTQSKAIQVNAVDSDTIAVFDTTIVEY